jgi:CheY-like chemotaxis protein
MSVIVVIDDNPDNVRLATRLMRASHEVHSAYEGEAGLSLVFDLKPDLVLVDLGLPDIDGQAIISMIRQDPLFSGTRIVAFTAYPEETALEIARVYRCDGVIHKPINTRAFAAQIESFLTSPRPADLA